MDTENTNEKNNIETFNNGIENIPFSTSVLVLGICSIVTCGCYGLPGLVCGIIAIIQSKRGLTAYEENPSLYKQGSLKNLKAGKTCATIGVILSSIYFLIVLGYVITVGTLVFGTLGGGLLGL
tara:strand:- start:169 stop:537 length:369 start_codon:yes stop_codon:yes gene_type:complete